MIAEPIDRVGNATFYAGEPIALEYQPRDADEAIEPLTGREFILAIVRADRSVVKAVTGTLVGGPDAHVAFEMADVTAGLIGVVGLRYQITETLAIGHDVIEEGRLTILPAAIVESSSAGLSESAPTARFTRISYANRPRLITSQRGARGLPGVNADEAENWIGFPTTGPVLAGEKGPIEYRAHPVTITGEWAGGVDQATIGPYVWNIRDRGETVITVDFSLGLTEPDVAFMTSLASRPAHAQFRWEAPGVEDTNLRGPWFAFRCIPTPV